MRSFTTPMFDLDIGNAIEKMLVSSNQGGNTNASRRSYSSEHRRKDEERRFFHFVYHQEKIYFADPFGLNVDAVVPNETLSNHPTTFCFVLMASRHTKSDGKTTKSFKNLIMRTTMNLQKSGTIIIVFWFCALVASLPSSCSFVTSFSLDESSVDIANCVLWS